MLRVGHPWSAMGRHTREFQRRWAAAQPGTELHLVRVIDTRTGTTTADLWPPGRRPEPRETRDIDDWLAVIAAGDAVGVTPEATTAQYRRDGIVFRPLRDAPRIPVLMTWRRDDQHPAAADAVALLTELYQR